MRCNFNAVMVVLVGLGAPLTTQRVHTQTAASRCCIARSERSLPARKKYVPPALRHAPSTTQTQSEP